MPAAEPTASHASKETSPAWAPPAIASPSPQRQRHTK